MYELENNEMNVTLHLDETVAIVEKQIHKWISQ